MYRAFEFFDMTIKYILLNLFNPIPILSKLNLFYTTCEESKICNLIFCLNVRQMTIEHLKSQWANKSLPLSPSMI